MTDHSLCPMPSHPDIARRTTKNPSVVPVGLNFGPTQLSISFFLGQHEYYTGVPGGVLYQSFYQDVLFKEVQCDLEHRPTEDLSISVPSFTGQKGVENLVQLFSDLIKSAIHMGISTFDNDPALKFKLMAITVPDHWNESTRTYVATASQLAGHPLDGSHMIISLPRAIQLSHQMRKYTEGIYKTLILDYNKSHLHLMLVEMYGTQCDVIGRGYLQHLGEDELHKAPVLDNGIAVSVTGKPAITLQDIGTFTTNLSINDNPAINLTRADSSTKDISNSESPSSDPTHTHSATSGAEAGNPQAYNPPPPDEFYTQRPVCHNQKAHFKPIVDAASLFMIGSKRRELPLEITADMIKYAFQDVKYIIIDGEASIPGLWDLRDAMESMPIENDGWTVIEGDKRDCGAYGAARAAWQQMQNPKHLGDWTGLPGYPFTAAIP